MSKFSNLVEQIVFNFFCNSKFEIFRHRFVQDGLMLQSTHPLIPCSNIYCGQISLKINQIHGSDLTLFIIYEKFESFPLSYLEHTSSIKPRNQPDLDSILCVCVCVRAQIEANTPDRIDSPWTNRKIRLQNSIQIFLFSSNVSDYFVDFGNNRTE